MRREVAAATSKPASRSASTERKRAPPVKVRQQSRERFAAAAEARKQEVCRTSSNATSVSSGGRGGDVDDYEDMADYDYPLDSMAGLKIAGQSSKGGPRGRTSKTYLNNSRMNNNLGGSTSSINNNDDTHTVNISIRDERAPPAAPPRPEPYSTIGLGRNATNGGTTNPRPKPYLTKGLGRNASGPTNPRSHSKPGARQGPHHPSPSPVRRSGNSPRKAPAATTTTPKVNGKPRQSIFAQKSRDDLVACKNCGRNFAEDRVEKHEDICFKTSKKKRKAYDSTKKRVEGTDAATFVLNPKKRGGAAGRQTAPKQNASQANSGGKKSDWRKKRQEFIETLRAAKAAQRHLAAGGKLSDLPPPPPMDTSDYIQCPHCGRKFAEAAADRHIPKCKNIKSNKR